MPESEDESPVSDDRSVHWSAETVISNFEVTLGRYFETMLIQVVKSKIHRVHVTQAELNYVGSITIDETLIEKANLVEGERVQIVNINNGERFETYVIKGDRNSGMICLNGPAARKVAVGDLIIIIGYGYLTMEEARNFQPSLVFPDETTNLLV